MTSLPYTKSNVEIIQKFITETKDRIYNGVDITFSRKAQDELLELSLDYGITTADVEDAILNLTVENYFTGIDPSRRADFQVCAFRTIIGEDDIEVYLKYGLHKKGLQILVFSNHEPNYPMNQPFKN